MRDATVSSGYLELHTRTVKGSSLTSAVGAPPRERPAITAFDKVGGAEQLVQVAQDYSSSPPRDAMITLFDASEKPAAVLIDFDLGCADDHGAVLYARDAPDLSNGKGVLDLITDEMGQVIYTAPTSQTTADGVVMHAVCSIRMLSVGRLITSRWGVHRTAIGMFFLGADGSFNQSAAMHFNDDDPFFQCVKNNKGEVVAYRTVTAKEYYVAAGVDATHVIALTAMAKGL